jgi:hypothetical protein
MSKQKPQESLGRLLNNLTALGLLTGLMLGSNAALAQTQVANDPSLELFRIRCQIDQDVNPETGALEPKVQIQAKSRASLLDGQDVKFWLENRTSVQAPPPVVTAKFIEGSASADWDTFPDPLNTAPVTVVSGEFAAPGEMIEAFAQVVATGQTVSDVGECADKTSAQFTQQTKNVCKLRDYNRGKCKSGDLLPDGTIMP